MAATLVFCSAPTTSPSADYHGWWAIGETLESEESTTCTPLVVPNQYSGDLACPNGAIDLAVDLTRSVYLPSRQFCNFRLHVCLGSNLEPSLPGRSFAGLYSLEQGTTCARDNPITSGCSCAGFSNTAESMYVRRADTPTLFDPPPSTLGFCVKP